jgi:hypothetical protein
MPTGKGRLNPAGLAKAAQRHLKVQAAAQGQVKNFITKLAKSKTFAAQFDEAVMKRSERAIRALLKEAGVKAKTTIEEIRPDRKIRFRVCVFGHCATVTIEW